MKNSPERESIAVIVVNYGTSDLAIRAVESVLKFESADCDIRIHLVDNASPNDDGAKLQTAHSNKNWGDKVVLYLEAKNHGFGGGNNVPLRAMASENPRPEKVLLLNPDAHLSNDAITILSDALNSDPNAGAAGAGILRPDLTKVTAAFRFPTPVTEFLRIANFGPLDRLLPAKRVPLPADHPAGPVDWVSGASVMFRFDAIAGVDFFDDRFFLYYEEVDLMRRLSEAGWRVLFEPAAHVVHEEGAATGQFAGSAGRNRDPAYMYESWAHYFSQTYGRFGAFLTALSHWPAAILCLFHCALRAKTPPLPLNYFKDHFRYVVRPLAKRLFNG